MNRHYDGERLREVLRKLRAIRRDDGLRLNLGADLIVGFPGETESDFADTLEIVEKYEITQLHAFPFSPHLDHYSVPAGSYPDQVPNHTAQARLKNLQKSGAEVFRKFAHENIGKELRVLVEKVSKTPLRRVDGDSQGGSSTDSEPDAVNSLHHQEYAGMLFSGWSENYLSCDETNFLPFADQEIVKGKVVRGIYKALKKSSKSED